MEQTKKEQREFTPEERFSQAMEKNLTEYGIAINQEYANALTNLREQFNEMQLFNGKLALVNKLFMQKDLSIEKKTEICARFDTIRTYEEASKLFKEIYADIKKQSTIQEHKEIEGQDALEGIKKYKDEILEYTEEEVEEDEQDNEQEQDNETKYNGKYEKKAFEKESLLDKLVLTFYISVGNLSPEDTKTFMMKAQAKLNIKEKYKDVEVFYIPTKGESRVELIHNPRIRH